MTRWTHVGIGSLLAATVIVAGCRGGFTRRGGARDLATPPPAGPPAAAFQLPPVSARVLPNGLTVLAVEYHELPIVIFHLLVQGGAAYDPAEKEGVAELTADLIRQGTQHRGAEELAREIEFLGGSIGGDAGYDFSSVSAEFLRKDMDQALDLFTDVVLHPAFRADEFRREQGLALAGIVASRESPAAIADRCFQAFLYGHHPYGHPTEGTEASVRRLTAADAHAFYERHYAPQGAVLVMIGDAGADDLLARAAGAFGGWSSTAAPAAALPAPARVHGRKLLLVDKPDATQAHIRVGNVAIARTDEAYIPAVVTATILGGGFGSRLIDELRVKRSLTYGASSYFLTHRQLGDFRAATFTKVPTTGEALELMLDVLRRFATDGATADELARAKSLLGGQYPLQLETPNAIAGKLAELTAYGIPRAELEVYPRRILATSAGDVRQIAGRYVMVEDAAVVVVGPAATIAPQLAGLGEAERTTPEACGRPDGPVAMP